jgi:hypothetical protein
MVETTRSTGSDDGRMADAMVRRMGVGRVRFSVTDALEMVHKQILPEDSTVELIDGEFVYRNRFELRGDTIVLGRKHAYVVTALAALGSAISNENRHVWTQASLICNETHAPIPDAIVLRGALDDYRDRFPTAADALSVIEVADASYERDAGEKLAGYARAGVQQYIIINLRNRTAEVYTTPDTAAGTYPPPHVITAEDELRLRMGENEFLPIALGDVLP